VSPGAQRRSSTRTAYITGVHAGAKDLDNAAAALAARLPEPLAPLARVAYNLAWSWLPDGDAIFAELEPHRWELCGHNPIRLLQEAPFDALDRAASDAAYLARIEAVEAALQMELARPAIDLGELDPAHPTVYFSAEFGVHRSLPIYSGGLGALAGDILKAASDRAMPMVAVGLMYHQGYFRQRIDHSGWQQEYWVETDPDRAPATLVTGDDGLPLTITVPIHDEQVVAQVWRVDVGRVPLYLLDAERHENSRITRWISSQLYVGDPHTRLSQYVLLGVGGLRAVRAMGIEPGLVHLNEGHAAFVSLELGDVDRTVFTTHTPVPAGNDTYPPEEVVDALAGLGIDTDEVVRRGRTNPDDPEEPFGVTQFALRASRDANGVSRRHGEVAREMWQPLWPGRAVEDVPIGYVTNGVHLPTWIGGPMRDLLDRHLGAGWLDRATEPATWEPVDGITDEELWAVRNRQRSDLVDYVRDRSVADRLSRDETREYVEAAARTFDPDVLTIGFARRMATYKRLTLLTSDPDRLLKLLHGDDDRPIQLLVAGKAHPRDQQGKLLVQRTLEMRGMQDAGSRMVFLHDYELGMASRLVAGCDVWVNLPRPPLEASGTSGMKSAVNGGLNLSVLDGWWPEAYDGRNGWALPGDVEEDQEAQDAAHASELYRLLEQEVVPTYYERDGDGMPREWIDRVRHALTSIGPVFGAARMVDDYAEQMYRSPARLR
jgi:starch phosphorylase